MCLDHFVCLFMVTVSDKQNGRQIVQKQNTAVSLLSYKCLLGMPIDLLYYFTSLTVVIEVFTGHAHWPTLLLYQSHCCHRSVCWACPLTYFTSLTWSVSFLFALEELCKAFQINTMKVIAEWEKIYLIFRQLLNASICQHTVLQIFAYFLRAK